MSWLSLGDPENVRVIYAFLTPGVILLLALSLYFGLRPGEGDERKWELAFIVYAVLLLNSSPHERYGVFESFWPMTFLLKAESRAGVRARPALVASLDEPSRLDPDVRRSSTARSSRLGLPASLELLAGRARRLPVGGGQARSSTRVETHVANGRFLRGSGDAVRPFSSFKIFPRETALSAGSSGSRRKRSRKAI